MKFLTSPENVLLCHPRAVNFITWCKPVPAYSFTHTHSVSVMNFIRLRRISAHCSTYSLDR